MNHFEAVCQLWEQEYIPILERWGFKIKEVHLKPCQLLGEERWWDIGWGEREIAAVFIYTFRSSSGVHIRLVPVCTWDIYSPSIDDAKAKARSAFAKIVERMVVSVVARRHIRYKARFNKEISDKGVQFQFTFTGKFWRWLAWSYDALKARNFRKKEITPMEVKGTLDENPIEIFPAFERAVSLALLL
jgi:hypothetical protein